ncbi:MAG TPA: hypothetical protein VIF57_02200 [Polyangia bacterium]|jgi:hypothetical protein
MDGPMLCGTAVCDMGQVCCYKKAPPLAICINPADFVTFMCEKMDLPCFQPTDCPEGTACCLNIMDFNNLTVSCKPQLLCPGDGVATLLACGSEMDCPTHAPACQVLGSAMGKDFKVCEPTSSPPPPTSTTTP